MKRLLAIWWLVLAMPAAAQNMNEPYLPNYGGHQPYQPAPLPAQAERPVPYGGIAYDGRGANAYSAMPGQGGYGRPSGGYPGSPEGHAPTQGGSYPGYQGGGYPGARGGGYPGYPGGYGAPQAPAYPSPGDTLQLGIQKLTGWLTQHPKAPATELRAWLEHEIAPLLDFDTMTRWSLGPMSRSVDNQQYGRVREAIRGMFLDAMSRQLAGYPVGDIQYLRPRGNPADGEVVLGIQVLRQDGYPLELQFRLHEGPFGWRVIDVEAEGASAVRYYRQLLSELAGRHGTGGMVERLPGR